MPEMDMGLAKDRQTKKVEIPFRYIQHQIPVYGGE
jgi:hypothetical protein